MTDYFFEGKESICVIVVSYVAGTGEVRGERVKPRVSHVHVHTAAAVLGSVRAAERQVCLIHSVDSPGSGGGGVQQTVFLDYWQGVLEWR